MLKKIMMASLAVGALALNAPAASATPPAALGCRFNGVSQATVTGPNTWESVVEGYVVSDVPGKTVSIRCEIQALDASNVWVTRGSTSTATNNTVAAVAERVPYTRLLTETVRLCAFWTNGSDSGTLCVGTTTLPLPPQEVIDALEDVFDILNDIGDHPLICPVLTSLNGNYGPIVIQPGTTGPNGETGGDVYVYGELWWDCPGYEA